MTPRAWLLLLPATLFLLLGFVVPIALQGLVARTPRQRDHVAVVGAGAFGGWTALSLLRAGMRVTLVDAWGAGNARASSGGETRVIRAAFSTELWLWVEV